MSSVSPQRQHAPSATAPVFSLSTLPRLLEAFESRTGNSVGLDLCRAVYAGAISAKENHIILNTTGYEGQPDENIKRDSTPPQQQQRQRMLLVPPGSSKPPRVASDIRGSSRRTSVTAELEDIDVSLSQSKRTLQPNARTMSLAARTTATESQSHMSRKSVDIPAESHPLSSQSQPPTVAVNPQPQQRRVDAYRSASTLSDLISTFTGFKCSGLACGPETTIEDLTSALIVVFQEEIEPPAPPQIRISRTKRGEVHRRSISIEHRAVASGVLDSKKQLVGSGVVTSSTVPEDDPPAAQVAERVTIVELVDLLVLTGMAETSREVQKSFADILKHRRVSIKGNTYYLSEFFMTVFLCDDPSDIYCLLAGIRDQTLMSSLITAPSMFLQHITSSIVSHNDLHAMRLHAVPAREWRDASKAKEEADKTVFVHDDVRRFMLDVVVNLRNLVPVSVGSVTELASVAMKRCAVAQAVLCGRSFVSPDDVLLVAREVLSHRLSLVPILTREWLDGDDGVSLASTPMKSARSGSVSSVTSSRQESIQFVSDVGELNPLLDADRVVDSVLVRMQPPI